MEFYFTSHGTGVLNFEKSLSISKSPGKVLLLMETILPTSYCSLWKPPYLNSAQCCVSYRNQSFVLLCKTNDWFLYETKH